MTFVLDAAALVALLRGEPAAVEVAGLLDGRDCSVSAVNVVEVVHRVSRALGLGPALVTDSVLAMVADGLEVVACDLEIGARAGTVRAEHYDRNDLAISLADCVVLATAERFGATLVTSDDHLVALASSLGVAVHPIPNSAGIRPIAG